MVRSYKVKLNTSSKKVSQALKQMAGVYRYCYNSCLDIQDYKKLHTYTKRREDHFLSGTELLNLVRISKKKVPFINKVDCGIFTAAVFDSSRAYTFAYRDRLPDFLSRKENPRFRTRGKIAIYHDGVHIPKFGKIKFYEKGYIPQGLKYSNITFTNDGNDWWLSVQVEEETTTETLTGAPVILDVNNNGEVVVNNSSLGDITLSENYLKAERKYKKLSKKLKRQTLTNHKSTKNRVETVKKLSKVKVRLDNIKKDYFKKAANEVARTKPTELHVLSNCSINYFRSAFLTRKMRRAGTSELFNIVVKKLTNMGTSLKRHLMPAELTALGSRV